MQEWAIVSAMLCNRPRFVGGRYWLSASNAVWEPVDRVSDDLLSMLTDELGNVNPRHYDALQLTDPKALGLMETDGLYTCYRMIESARIDFVGLVPSERVYEAIQSSLEFVGWDICSGNGWLSASCHGIYPIDPFTGVLIDENAKMINEFGLFRELRNCLRYCKANDQKIADHAPWFPVGVLVSKDNLRRIRTKPRSA